MIYDHTLFVLLEKFEDIKGVIRSCCIHILYVKYINKIKLVFSWVRVVQSLDFCVVFCRSLFVLLYFFFSPLCCLSFFDIRILITPLVSSNFSFFGGYS